VRSKKADNGLKLGPAIVRGFDVVKVPEEEAKGDAAQDSAEQEKERLEKTKEIIERLKSGPPPQIQLAGPFTHLGNKRARTTSDSSPTKKKRKSLEKSPKKKKKSKK
jgi:hypothetical protein